MTNDSGHTVRSAEATDGERLAAFVCAASDSPDRVGDVDEFVRTWALHWTTQMAHEDRRLPLLFVDDDLAAVGAHKQQTFWEAEPHELGRLIQVIALDVRYQGRAAPGGSRYSDIMLDALIDDLLMREPPNPIVSAIIDRDNDRSLALFRRQGFHNTAGWPGGCVIVW